MSVNDHQLTVVAQHLVAIWRPLQCTETMGPKTIIPTVAQTIPNFNELQFIGYVLMCERDRCVVISARNTLGHCPT